MSKVAGVSSVLTYKMRRLAGKRPQNIQDVATARHVLRDWQEFDAIPPVVFDHHWAKIKKGTQDATVQDVIDDMRLTRLHFSPSIVYELQDACLLNDCVYAGGYKRDLYVTTGALSFLSGPVEKMDSAGLVSTYTGSRWFAHWLWDELPAELALREFAEPIMRARPKYSHEEGYRAAMSLPEIRRVAASVVRKMYIMEEVDNADKIARKNKLRQKIKDHFGTTDRPRVFILRGNTGTRRVLQNEQEVAQRFEKEGFRILSVEKMSAEEILRACSNATQVVGVEGSQVAHAGMCAAEGSEFTYLVPPYRVGNIASRLDSYHGILPGMYICDPVGESEDTFRVDPEEVLRFTEHVHQVNRNDPERIIRYAAQFK